jgi:hypothetical protein
VVCDDAVDTEHTIVARLVHYPVCRVCGHQRVGSAAIGWPRSASICAKCSDVAWRSLDVGVDALSPRRQAS